MPAHVDELALKDVLDVGRMRRVDQCALRLEQILMIVALNCLVEKRKPDQQYDSSDDQDRAIQSAALDAPF